MEREKVKKIRSEEEIPMDRLSSLPDALLHHILSLMDTTYAVRTCILSKRWVNLWTHLHTLNFDCYSFRRVCDFKTFTERVLEGSCKSTNVLAFRIRKDTGVIEESLFSKIMKFAESHRVEKLDLSFFYPKVCNRSLLDFSTFYFLRILKLDGNFEIGGFPNALGWTSLTTLHLERVRLSNENNCHDLFSSCLNLQTLVLITVFINVSEVFKISAPQLVNLTILHAYRDTMFEYLTYESCKVVITAPRLLSFKFYNKFPLLLSVVNSPFLDEVNIRILSGFTEVPEDDIHEEYISALVNMLRMLGAARSFILSSNALKVLSLSPELLEAQPAPFSNLKSLKVEIMQKNCISTTITSPVKNFLLLGSPNPVTVVMEFPKS